MNVNEEMIFNSKGKRICDYIAARGEIVIKDKKVKTALKIQPNGQLLVNGRPYRMHPKQFRRTTDSHKPYRESQERTGSTGGKGGMQAHDLEIYNSLGRLICIYRREAEQIIIKHGDVITILEMSPQRQLIVDGRIYESA